MQKKSKKHGKSTLVNEVIIQGISLQGIWLLVNNQEFFLDFKHFPWFIKATIEQIYNVELQHKNHLYWPDIDVDLELESLSNPEAYPLSFNG